MQPASTTTDKRWRDAWDIDGTVAYLRNKGFTRVTLQFPDELLEQSTVICAAIVQECVLQDIPARVSILADTTYNALNVDEVAAQHADADCVVHYGRASMSPLSCLPAYFVFGQQTLDVEATAARIADYASTEGSENKAVLVFMDQLLLHAATQLQAHVQQIQQTCQQTMHVLYAEVQGRTMDPANGEPSSLNLQADSKHQTNIRCCQRVPSASCATSTAAAEAPAQRAEHAMAAEPAMSAEPAGVTGSEPAERAVPVMPQHTQGQSVAIAAEVDARSLSHTVPSSQNPVVEMLQSPHSKLAEESNPATVKQQQNAPLAAASSPQLTASQADSDNAPANRRSGADALQRCNATDETATGNPSCDTTQCVTGQIAGYTWTLPPGMQQEDCVMMWVGPEDAAALTHLQLTFNKSHWVTYDPEQDKWQEGLPMHISRTLMRRYFLVEKAKNANVIGILVGTLGVAGYRDAIDSIRSMAKQAGKKTYTMLMGKPNPAKLANLPEVEIFVMVADPQGMILDSKEFYAPIITPFEAYLAFSGDAEWDGSYSLDFTALQTPKAAGIGGVTQQPRFSLLDGAYHANGAGEEGAQQEDSLALAKRAQQALQLSGPQGQVLSASEYLQKRRTFRGLEAPIVGAEKKPVVKIVQGQTGRATQYTHEATS